MAGEINGTNLLMEVSTDGINYNVIAGQLEVTNTYTGTPIDISNKSFGDNVTLLDGEMSANGFSIGGNFVYNTSASYQALRDAQESGTILSFVLSDLSSPNRWLFDAAVTGLSDTIPQGAAVTTSLTLTSSGAPTKT